MAVVVEVVVGGGARGVASLFILGGGEGGELSSVVFSDSGSLGGAGVSVTLAFLEEGGAAVEEGAGGFCAASSSWRWAMPKLGSGASQKVVSVFG